MGEEADPAEALLRLAEDRGAHLIVVGRGRGRLLDKVPSHLVEAGGVQFLARLQETELDQGFLGFQPSNLELTTVDVGNPTTNLIPATARARLNIRFNPNHKGQDLADWIARLDADCPVTAASPSPPL